MKGATKTRTEQREDLKQDKQLSFPNGNQESQYTVTEIITINKKKHKGKGCSLH